MPTWGLLHDVKIWGVEAEGSGGQAVSDKVDPQELDGDESLGKTKSSSQEDAHDLTDVGRNEITDELFHVVVDGTTLFNSSPNGGEVVVSKHHLGGRLGDGSSRTHGNTNLGLLQGRCVIHTITSHGRDLTQALEVLNNLGLVERLHTREETGLV